MSGLSEDDLDQRRLVQRVDALHGRRCRLCGGSLCDHVLLFNVVMGFYDEPTCTTCFAGSLAATPEATIRNLRAYVDHRECTRAAWAELSLRDPSCPLASLGGYGRGVLPRQLSAAEVPAADGTWDAGDLGCGDLVLELRGRLRNMRPRSVLRLTARDPGAPADIPAWCGLTGHSLVFARHPDYYIRRKDD